jgi:uncharacterized protein YndB with AHSA1/START domain
MDDHPVPHQAAGSTPDASHSSDLELVITRTFDAPRKLVFKLWTQAEHLAHWWGPEGFTLPSCEIDLRPGGAYRFQMRGPDGDDHWLQGVFHEVVESERLVMAGFWADSEGNPKGPTTVITVTFEEHAGKTVLTFHQAIFESITARDAHHNGWTSTFDRLTKYLLTR